MNKAHKFIERFALLGFLIWSLFLVFESIAFGPTSYVRLHDNGDGRLPTRLSLARDVWSGDVGFRNPDLLAGVDRIAEANSLDLTNLLFLALPGWLAYGLLLIIQKFVAGYFTYKVLREFSASALYAFVPALFFAAYFQPQINNQFDGFAMHYSLGIPATAMVIYILWRINKVRDLSLAKTMALSALAGVGFSLVSNFAFTLFLFPILVLWFFAFHDKAHWKRLGVVLLAFSFGWFLLETLEIIPSFWAAWDSHRNLRGSCLAPAPSFGEMQQQLGSFVLNPPNTVLLVTGTMGVLLAGDGRFRSMALWSGAISLFLFVLSLFGGLIACNGIVDLGFLEGFNFSRFNLFIPFFFSVFAAFGLQALVSVRSKQLQTFAYRWLPALFIAVCLIQLSLTAGMIKNETTRLRAAGFNYANFYENPYLDQVAELLANEEADYRMAVVSDSDRDFFRLHPGFLWPYGINTIDGYTVLYPMRFQQFWAAVLQPIGVLYPDCSMGITYARGRNRSYLSDHCELGYPVDDFYVDDLYDFNLLSLAGVRYVVSSREIESRFLTPIDMSSPGCSQAIPGCINYLVYENTLALPSYFLLSDIQGHNSDSDVLEKISALPIEIVRTRGFVRFEDIYWSDIGEVSDEEGEINLMEQTADSFHFFSNLTSPKLLVINATFVPNWKATLDEESVRVFPVNHLLTGLYVPAGQHEIKIRYASSFELVFDKVLSAFVR